VEEIFLKIISLCKTTYTEDVQIFFFISDIKTWWEKSTSKMKQTLVQEFGSLDESVLPKANNVNSNYIYNYDVVKDKNSSFLSFENFLVSLKSSFGDTCRNRFRLVCSFPSTFININKDLKEELLKFSTSTTPEENLKNFQRRVSTGNVFDFNILIILHYLL
jgi:hypothetical protein